jgi:hypothetical protein
MDDTNREKKLEKKKKKTMPIKGWLNHQEQQKMSKITSMNLLC